MTHSIGHLEKVRALAATARLLAVGGARAGVASQVTIYDHVANKTLRTIDLPAHVHGLVFAEGRLAAACADGSLRILDVDTGDIARSIDAHPGGVTAVAAAPGGGGRVATAGADGALRIWALGEGEATEEPVAAWTLAAAPLRAVAFDAAGEVVAAAGDDGVVRVIPLATGAERVMAGHEGPVLALAFTPRDGRLASAGEDGTVRLWYLVGEVEHELRGRDKDGHAGAVHALLAVAPPAPEGGGEGEIGDRVVSVGADGKARIWRVEDRRKPRTLDTGGTPVFAMALAPVSGRNDRIATLFLGGDARTVWRAHVDAQGMPEGSPESLDHGFSALAQALSGAKAAREGAVRAVAALDEPEALELALKALRSDKDAEVRALAARELAARGRRQARRKLREALDDGHAMVRLAAFDALRTLEPDMPLAPLRAALEARAADVRARALVELAKLAGTSPLVPGLIAEKLADKDADVRLTALAQLLALEPGSAEPLRAAFERGPADLRVEAIVQATIAGWLSTPVLAPVVSRALDDEDAGVRRIAFAAKVLERRALAHALEARDPDLGRAILDIARRLAQARLGLVRTLSTQEAAPTGKGAQGKGAPAQGQKISDEAIQAARAAIPGVGEPGAHPVEADLEPLLGAMACRTPDTAVRGARGLAQLGDTRALGALLQLSREADAALRAQAATALQELADPRAEKRLVWMFDDADAAVRAAALDAYARLAAPAPLAVAEAALRSSHEDIRVRGLDRLVKIAEADRTAEAETLLADAIEDEGAKVRGEAFRTLWSWHAKDPARALDRALAARFPDLRLRAVEELKAQGDKPWALERLEAAIGDRDASVAQAAYDAVVKIRGKEQPGPHLAAIASIHATLRANGARGAAKVASPEPVRSPLLKLLEDTHEAPRTAAIEALDALLPNENGPLRVGLQSSFLDLRVRAAELAAIRHDEHLADPMRALLSDKTLFERMPIQVLAPLRQRASTALATLAAPKLLRYFATELLKDDDPAVREQAARGLAMAARRGDEGYLLDAMGHADVAVRSWAADGLARLGDVRALPVLTGTLRHTHAPIRVASIMSFAALGPEGYGGMLQGLEDPAREVQEIVFAIVLARDLRAFRRGEPPDLLTSALSSQRADVRFAAARALELRTDPEAYLAHLIEALTPPRPEKERAGEGAGAGAGAKWPTEQERARILVGLAEALASDNPEQRYAAAQALRLRNKPAEYFREARRVGQIRPAGAPYVADTTPRAAEETDAKPGKGWLRKLFARGVEAAAAPPPPPPAGGVGRVLRRIFGPGQAGQPAQAAAPGEVPEAEQRRLRWLAFGAYMGLLRQVAPGDDEGHRVRRDAIDRIVALCNERHVSTTAAIPPLVRALDDPHHLVRKAAFAGLRALFPAGSDEPLSLGLSSASADVARAALDELASRGEAARPRIVRALGSTIAEVRRYAFELLEKLSPKGSLEPLLAALGSEHADLRLGVLERLTTASDPRVVPALVRAMESDHEDLRLRAAELLARRRDDRAVDVLATFLRADQPALVGRASEALVALATPAAVRALAARLEDATAAERVQLAHALGQTRTPEAIEVLAGRFEDEAAEVRAAAFQAALAVAGREKEKRDHALALRFLRAAARAKDPALRLLAARELDAGDDPAAAELLAPLLADRGADVRAAAVAAYARRVIDKGAPVAPLEAILRAGARDLMLAAAEGVAARGLPSALRPLLLFVRAGEPGERERALLALGTLGDGRALEELETVAGGGTKEAPVEISMQAAATEALGRIANKLPDPETTRRVIERVEQALLADAGDIREAAARGMRWIGGERGRVQLERLAAHADTPERLRVVAVTELGNLGDVAAEATLGRALDLPSAEVRKHARKALEKLFPSDRVRIELLAVESGHADMAGPAASYLATEARPEDLLPRLATLKEWLRGRLRMGLLGRAALPAAALAGLLADERTAARREAAWLVAARTGAADGAAALVEDVGRDSASAGPSADRVLLAAAAAKAERIAAERWARQHGAEREAEAQAWRDAIWAARRLGAAAAAAPLRGVLTGGDRAAPVEVRREAARALGALARAGAPAADAEAALAAALQDMDPGVRAAAAAALAALAPDRAARLAAGKQPFDPAAFDPIPRAAPSAVRGELLATEPGRRLALPAALVAGETAKLLELARGASDEPTRLDAIAALGHAGTEDAVALLGSLAFDKTGGSLALRKAAYRAYRRAKRRLAKGRAAPAAASGGQGAHA